MRDAARIQPSCDEDKNRLLFNLLGLEDIRIFSAQPMVDRISTVSHDEFRSAVKSVFQVPVNPFRAYYDLEQRRQGGTESTQDYLTALRSLMADCDFDGRENHHLAVRLVCGCFSHETQKKLLALSKIDLDEVVRIMQADESQVSTQAINTTGQHQTTWHADLHQLWSPGSLCQRDYLSCTEPDMQPVCGKHFIPITAEVDKAAQISGVTEATYMRHFAHLPLLPAATPRNFDNTVLFGRSLGRFLTQVKNKNRRVCAVFYVLPPHCSAVIGQNLISALGLQIDGSTMEIRAVTHDSVDIAQDYPRLLSNELGTFPDSQHAIANSVRSFIFDPNAPTFVTTAASDVRLGAVLSQTPQGREIPIAHISHTLQPREQSYAVNEKEALAQTDHLSLLDLKSATKRDSTLSTVLHFVSSGWPSKKTLAPDIQQIFAVRDELQTEDQCLLRENRTVLPTVLRRRLLAKAHEGHPGIVRMKPKLRQSYWWPGQDKDIENFVKHCAGCQLSDKSLAPSNVSATSIPLPESPWQKVAIDVTKFLVVLIDYKSKFPEILMASNVRSSTIIGWLDEVFSRFGAPDELVIDNRPQFTSMEFTNFLQKFNIHDTLIAVYNPQENGCVERFNQYLKHGIQAFLASGEA
ncbi:LOW QUALITY PROTEIN: Pol polyprotein [Plakobranchus ocellatus]|uniref:Pol polyprotein n=1 Tax=Plakobranchus ocellatus TaxID=259542 RepID=A0AAV3Y6L9_9GAST|nr:LOW QUALITY PROTEIN: Pol polyprotein [Plakobranchus ocellatus]